MVSVFPMLTRQEPYHELGARYFDERRRHYTVDRLAQRIERLGYRVHLEPVATTVCFRRARVNLDFPIGGFSPPEGRLARGFKPPAFSRFLFQSAVKSAESF